MQRRDRGERHRRRDDEKDAEGKGREKEILVRDRGKETEFNRWRGETENQR